MTTTTDLAAELRAECPEAMALWDAELRAMYRCPDWCVGDPHAHDVSIWLPTGGVAVTHEGSEFGGSFYAWDLTHPETGVISDVSVSVYDDRDREDPTPERLREIAAGALAAAEWLEAHRETP
jgi:hypothetical protein